jgi:hypothetical protein
MTFGRRFAVFTRDRFTCQYCGRTGSETILQVDHILPRAAGGTDDLANLITACHVCNLGKSARIITTDWVPVDKNPHAVALGRKGGLKGGIATRDKLTPEQRRENARRAARARWGPPKA